MNKFAPLIIILSCTFLFLAATGQVAADNSKAGKINWSTYDDAQKPGNDSRKFFLYFFTEQCGYCKLLESKTFTDETVAAYINDNYTPVRVNAGREIKTASRFGIQGVPDLRFLSPEGESIARWPGFIESKPLLILLQYISTDSYKKMNFNDFVKEHATD